MVNATASVEPHTLRRAMGRFPTGVAVVTTFGSGGTPHGMTVNSLTSVSLEPPLLLVCLTVGARSTRAVVEDSRIFTINLLSVRQEQIAKRFARRGADHFEGLPVTCGRHRVPVVPNALAHLECDVERDLVAGDHVIVVGRVRAVCERPGEPLAFHGGKFGDVVTHGDAAVPWFW